MSTHYTTLEGDVLDLLCFKHYKREGLTELVLEANPGLAEYPPHLPAGLAITFPVIPTAPSVQTRRLWG